MVGAKSVVVLGLLVSLLVPVLCAQKAPLLTVSPRGEQVRRLELQADVMMARKRYHQASEFYQQALKLDSQNAPVANKLGIAYHQLQDLGRARSWYERAAKIDKNYAEAWNNLGTVYYHRKDYKKAIRNYQRALEIRPESAHIHSNLGTAYFARKQYEEAVQEYRLALLIDPTIFEQRSPFGVLVHERSVEDLARFHFVLAKSFATIGDVERCLAYLRRALEEGFKDIERLYTEPEFLLIREDIRFQELVEKKPPAVVP